MNTFKERIEQKNDVTDYIPYNELGNIEKIDEGIVKKSDWKKVIVALKQLIDPQINESELEEVINKV